MLIGCSVVSSCYTLVWDLKMDWGLLDRGAGENTFLREEIVYPQKVHTHRDTHTDTHTQRHTHTRVLGYEHV